MSDAYEVARTGSLAREASGLAGISEIEIQARLFAGEFGTVFLTPEGGRIEVEHFGEWNREAGPDFRGAVVRLADGQRVEGDIEVDRAPGDWEAHGHAVNPAFANVVLQLFAASGGARAFARTCEHRVVAQAGLGIEGPLPPPRAPERGTLPVARVVEMAGLAAGFRFRRKCAARECANRWHGSVAALLHAVASGLGYKDNAIPMLLVAQRSGLGRGGVREAVLFGLAGFLEPRSFDDADEVTKSYLKPLWDEWWSVRDAMARIVLDRGLWKLGGVRPANHPHRRLGALAAVASHGASLVRAGGVDAFESVLGGVGHDYWRHHWNLRASRLTRPVALIGKDRIRDLTINAFLPGRGLDAALAALRALPGPTPSTKVVRACEWLCGAPHPELTRSAMAQQGLLQLLADFGHLRADEVAERLA